MNESYQTSKPLYLMQSVRRAWLKKRLGYEVLQYFTLFCIDYRRIFISKQMTTGSPQVTTTYLTTGQN